MATNTHRIRHTEFALVCTLLLALATPAVFGQSLTPSVESTSSFDSSKDIEYTTTDMDFLSRSALTRDRWGARSTQAENGVTLDLRYTFFYQGLVSGTGNQDFDYGGKVDAFIDLDSGRMGLWNGGGFHSHIEYAHGDLASNLGGALFASNTALYWPVGTAEEVVATSLYFTQKTGERSSLALGKFNPVDLLAADPFFGGWGIDRFMNLILAAPPSGLIPVVFMGAVANIRTEPLTWTIMVFDPNDRTNDYFPGDLFEDGVNVAVSGALTTTLAGRKTTYALNGLYSTAEGIDYSSIGGGVFNTSTKSGSYNISFEFKHNLQESSEQPSASWGFYFKGAIADGNPNYVENSLIAGVGGRALFIGRAQDTFGLGMFYYNLSDVLRDPIHPSAIIDNEAAIELFYNYALTPWLDFGPDIQYVKPARGRFDKALIVGLRMQIRI